jgi:acyl-CoA dehydrogenase
VEADKRAEQVGKRSHLLEKVRKIADEVAGPASDSVDREARFPREAIDGLKKERLLSACVPEEFGGFGCTISELSAMCQFLGQRCSAAAMVLAMHHIQVACIVRHGHGSPFFRHYLGELVAHQNLIASVTSEVGVGGDLRKSVAGVDGTGPSRKLEKNAPTISYGEHADELLVTCRKSLDAAPGDQVLVLLRRPEYTLERTGTWDTLGMRGTCSPSFRLFSTFPEEQILPVPFPDIAMQTMVPFSHILWASCWLGIATDAVARARGFVRAEARKTPGAVPPGALRVAEVTSILQSMRAQIQGLTREYEDLADSPQGIEELSSMGYALKMNNLKISASQLAVQIAGQALLICGMAGYKSDSKFSVGRHIRDAHSAALMIGNDRIYATNASLLLVHKDD